jgi:DNA-binding GntR family transcriptional regulator
MTIALYDIVRQSEKAGCRKWLGRAIAATEAKIGSPQLTSFECGVDVKELPFLQKPELLTARATVFLREAIVERRLRPGQKIVERQLAEHLNISRSTLREVLRQLSSEGLVTVLPRRSTTVSEVSLQEAEELFAVRLMIESFCVRIVAKGRPIATIAKMRRLVEAMRSSLLQENLAAFAKAGKSFHEVMVDASGNNSVAELYERTKAKFRRYQALMVALPELPRRSVNEHQAILDAIVAGDPDRSAASLEAHLQHLIRQLTASQASFLPEVVDSRPSATL